VHIDEFHGFTPSFAKILVYYSTPSKNCKSQRKLHCEGTSPKNGEVCFAGKKSAPKRTLFQRVKKVLCGKDFRTAHTAPKLLG
jgi:hypothetical protein